ncbi:glucose--fructose oxidoreductase [Asticcacaulis biprosthecium C19]|uniref:Glucose--fructose oxidoreductase n=1 Tax=Asticcacaulis biprosthecium C19 TaxID=715226 RepID=F4QLP6_9CAUL|nr:Gfo/Idh/MocA family oxidoreductase [Asticcacaulis biprosthecium]EGF93544.1 glucose--fructose oxidoreductase [Asticcacaulis biprosthecium C19]
MTESTTPPVGRRAVIAGAAAGVASAVAPKVYAGDSRKAYAIVGCGSRARMFQDALWGPHKYHGRLVAVCDTNPGRMAYVDTRAAKAGAPAPKAYGIADFSRMVRETKPDALIVTTPDAYHVDYILRALDAGLDVITEKPMTTDAVKAQAILDAVKRTGGKVRVSFNYRYSPFRSQIKEILMSGAIGDILSVDFHWLLNTVHGADYFRRWHGNKAISGGLMVHKATHHFDLVNWWLSDMPATVNATGKRQFYTPEMARRLGLSGPHDRCHTCPEKAACTFQLDLAADPGLKALYLDNEHHDGYFRDRCVFRPDISIEDTMNVIVGYEGGATLSYSLNAFNAWEGYHVAFNGTKGRLEHHLNEQATTAGSGAAQSEAERGGIRLIPLRQAAQDIPLRTGTGSHGGGDAVMLADIFDPHAPADPLLRTADERGGAASILIGVAANRCFETGQPVRIDSLVTGLGRPAYPPMPGRDQPVPMPLPA